MSMLLRWALREIYHNWKASLVFILNLSLGLTGFVTLDAFNVTLKKYLNENSKKILSADIGISARRQITDEELKTTRKIIGEPLRESQMYEFFAMLSAGTESRLVMVKAIDENYPFYGELTLDG
jgi:putative ABC transport system permease protein